MLQIWIFSIITDFLLLWSSVSHDPSEIILKWWFIIIVGTLGTCPYQNPVTTILIKQINICVCVRNQCCCNFSHIWNMWLKCLKHTCTVQLNDMVYPFKLYIVLICVNLLLPFTLFTLTITLYRLIQSDTTIILLQYTLINLAFTEMVWDDWMLSTDFLLNHHQLNYRGQTI